MMTMTRTRRRRHSVQLYCRLHQVGPTQAVLQQSPYI